MVTVSCYIAQVLFRFTLKLKIYQAFPIVKKSILGYKLLITIYNFVVFYLPSTCS